MESFFESLNDCINTSRYDLKLYWYISEIADNELIVKNRIAPLRATGV